MQAHTLSVTRTAHYYTLGTPGSHIKNVWLVCHGYGQLARTFIHRFSDLDDGKTLIIAPEGLNYFYWGGFSGDPVATWMTRENRLDEIADYTNYLQQLYDYFITPLSAEVKISFLGFSQGVQTISRYLLAKQPHFHRLVLWAGLLPDDLNFKQARSYFAEKELHFIYGTEDELIKEKYIQWQLDFAERQQLDLTVHQFKGKHVVERAALLKLVENW